ncbi:ATP-binding protein [Aquipuribacter hungaricus]|uniref:ATP-binding protein n=1 Tax=Aquipuribacter hungaricus TaxID=545624 RepID=A0ABV7WH22_9MICO
MDPGAHAQPGDAGAAVPRSLTLPPDPASAARARAMLRQVLDAAGRQEWLDTTELACSELITNAIVHAHTEIVVTVTVGPDEVLVEVRDSSPMLPVQRSYDSYATTGRGMGLVAVLAAEHGIRDAGPHGKTAWFVVRGTPDAGDGDDLLAAWDDSAWDEATRDAVQASAREEDPAGAEVVLLGIPPTLWFAAREHHDAILRELMLHLATDHAGLHEPGSPDSPDGTDGTAAAVDLAAADLARSTISTALWAAVDARLGPRPAGTRLPAPTDRASLALEPYDLRLRVPDEVAAAFPRLKQVLDLAELLAAEGRLFVRPALPEVVAVRDWACGQVVAQHGGARPEAWEGAAHDRFVAAGVPVPRAHPEWDTAEVRSSPRAVVAADDAGRVVAVSPSMAALVGWDVGDLAGQRIVALVPARLREAHVAGFTRHLATGETVILGLHVTLPVLHADGHEVACRVLIEPAPGAPEGTGRFLAWFDPAGDSGGGLG